MSDDSNDDQNAPRPTADPNPDPSPVLPEQLPPGRIGYAVDQVALVALVFVATLLLLVGATRLVDRGTASPGPISSVAGVIASASPSPTGSASQAPRPS
ncbi:MAG: hypothetical protein K0S97_1291, partial [Chloroflexota bacterium]|nr:hypothetical protein [Chloroflexota bacterium]